MGISFATIRRRYDIGLDSIVALVGKLEDEIERLVAIKADGDAEIIVERLVKRVTQLETAISSKEAELHEARHQNVGCSPASANLNVPSSKALQPR